MLMIPPEAGVRPSANEIIPPAPVGRLATIARLLLAHSRPLIDPVQVHNELAGVRVVLVVGPGQSLQRTWAGGRSGEWPCELLQMTRPSSCWFEVPMGGQLGEA